MEPRLHMDQSHESLAYPQEVELPPHLRARCSAGCKQRLASHPSSCPLTPRSLQSRSLAHRQTGSSRSHRRSTKTETPLALLFPEGCRETVHPLRVSTHCSIVPVDTRDCQA